MMMVHDVDDDDDDIYFSCVFCVQLRTFCTLPELIDDALSSKFIKHPDQPRPPSTIFMRFIKENLPRLSEQYKSLLPAEIMRKLTELYNNRSSEEKKRYEDEYKTEMEEYRNEVNKFRLVSRFQLVLKFWLVSNKWFLIKKLSQFHKISVLV